MLMVSVTQVWSLETGKRLVTLRNHTDGVTCLQFNDSVIVSGSYDKTVKLWDFSCCWCLVVADSATDVSLLLIRQPMSRHCWFVDRCFFVADSSTDVSSLLIRQPMSPSLLIRQPMSPSLPLRRPMPRHCRFVNRCLRRCRFVNRCLFTADASTDVSLLLIHRPMSRRCWFVNLCLRRCLVVLLFRCYLAVTSVHVTSWFPLFRGRLKVCEVIKNHIIVKVQA